MSAARAVVESSHFAGLRARMAALELPPGLEAARGRLRDAAEALGNLERRVEEGPSAPLRVAFFGPTGAGKSKLFNSVLGSEVSPACFRRPFTMQPVYSLHEAHRALAARIDGQVRFRSGDSWRDCAIIDTPDFDSVERHNRDVAERIFRETEALVFVTDVQKYADQSTWEYLDRIERETKPLLIVLNKVVSGKAATEDLAGAVVDFRSRLRGRRGADELITVRDLPVDDATLLPVDEPGVVSIREGIRRIVGSPGERRATLVESFRADLERLLGSWDAAADGLRRNLDEVAGLRSRLEIACARARARIDEVSQDMDADLRAEVYARVADQIRRIDILRYPRQLLAIPWEGARRLAGRLWPSRKGAGAAASDTPARSGTFQTLEGALLALDDEMRRALDTEQRTRGILDGGAAPRLRIEHDELVVMFDARERAYREWVQGEARETASKLTGENKAKFILTQVIYNSIVVGVQIHTAGHFTLVELATDGVLSPLVAKAAGMAISSERVREFERIARERKRRLLLEIVDEAKARYAGYLDAREAFRPALDALAAEVDALRRRQAELLDVFQKAGGA